MSQFQPSFRPSSPTPGRRRWASAWLAGVTLVLASPATAQVSVFDPANYSRTC